MILKRFENLPERFQNERVREYYEILSKKKCSCFFKQLLDFIAAAILFVILLVPGIIIALVVKCTSKGPIFYRQVRVGRYGREFKIFKFRTMVTDADKIGTQITVGARDPRITSVGVFLRKYRLDEFPQILNVLCGDMGFVGARPEVPKYVNEYSDEMLATLLIKPGITGYASIRFKNENELLGLESDPERCYINHIMPAKMRLDLDYIRELSVWTDIKVLFGTVFEVVK